MANQIVRRRIYVVDKKFQHTFMFRFAAMVLGGVAMSFLLLAVYYHFRYSGPNLPMKFFYLSNQPGAGLEQVPLVALILPPLVVATALSVFFTFLLGLLYSHRIAGPLYNLKRVLRRFREGDMNQVVRFRKHDEFHDLAAEVSRTIVWMRSKLKKRR
jgi:methyl-accepting chemotaxis protein